MIFRREFSRSLKALIIWSVLLSGLIFLVLSMYPTFAEQQDSLQKMFDAFPESLQKVFGMHELDFSTIIGFYAIEAYLIVALFGSIYAAMLAANILAKEESEKTIEFLLSMPVTRNTIVSSKLLLVIVNLFIFNALIALVSWLGFLTAGETPAPTDFLWLVIGSLLTHLIFASAAFLLSATLRRGRNTWPVAIGIVLFTYFLDAIAGISAQTEFLKHFSPFQYFNATDILAKQGLPAGYTMITCAIIVVCISATYAYYHQKDIV